MTDEADIVLIDLREVMRRVSLTKSTIYKMQRSGNFPKSVKLEPRTVRWVSAEVDAWIRARLDARHD